MSFQYSKFNLEINNLYKISLFGARRGLNPFVLSLVISNEAANTNLVNHAELILKTPYAKLTDFNVIKSTYADQLLLVYKEFNIKTKTEMSVSWISMTYHLANALETTFKAIIEPNTKKIDSYDLQGEILHKQKKSIKKSFTAQNFQSYIRELDTLINNIDESFGLETLSWLIIN